MMEKRDFTVADYEKICEAFGGYGEKVESLDQIAPPKCGQKRGKPGPPEYDMRAPVNKKDMIGPTVADAGFCLTS